MASAIPVLPEQRVADLYAPYKQELAAKRRITLIGALVLLVLTMIAGRVAEVDADKFFSNIYRFTDYFHRLFFLDTGASVFTDVREWFWGLQKWTRHILDTLLIAYLGTLFGAIGAFLICFAATMNLAVNPARRFLARRFLEFCRTVPEIVFALIFVVAFGLGPVPGVLAIMIHTVGALGKLFAEVVENIDMKPVEGAIASGATRWQAIRYAAVPQVLPNFASYALLRFEINVRGASVMGFVGAGGIGQELIEAIRKFYYSDVSAILLLIIATVMIIDLVTERIRHSLISQEHGR
ncbi:MAG: phosphonate ABC transporter, permease protein PhnE [Methylocystis sp.]|jgi:phosphonate transport system permease protein|nr:phosphonate ABC transporter, permease protein PhnE [Methylocystis sp.]MCA3585023.1 phosphonate ABC transporter, permease protein PhnE [Methylocystis sp.]MCA3586953.1 phosphonate ABC transporter, permease protein PhnE [Methylocystis sp.]MCA3592241.1 phosphonate ABC transporter, permease protein PhnE [Methylocystis sp.]